MLFAATSINYMDRQVLGILAPTLQHALGWTEQQYGYIVSSFQVAYAIGLVLAGRMVDRLGTRIGYVVVMGVWSLAAMGHALVSSVLGFGVARFFLGLGESGNFPAAIKTTAEWFPQRERSLATGLFNSGANVGAIVAPFTIPWITLHYGWRVAFLATGGFSLLWIVWWGTCYRRPEQHPRVSASELALIRGSESASQQAGETDGEKLTWRALLRYRQTWAFTLAKFLTDPIWYFYLFWLPKFLDGRFHLGLTHIGLPLILVYTLSSVGSIGGGYLPSLLSRGGRTIQSARIRAMLLCACLAIPVLVVGRTWNEWLAVGLLGLATAAHQGWSANLFTTASDMFPQHAVGAVVGIGGMAGSMGGVLFAAATGRVLQVTGSYSVLFVMAASAYLLGLLVLTQLAPRLRPAVAARNGKFIR
jgi:ACS family hexuronate transporter-like MFS transporter